MSEAEQTASNNNLDLPWWTVAIMVLPSLVLLSASILLMNYGTPSGALSNPSVANGQAETAGRISVLATAILCSAVGLLSLYQFGRDLRLFNSSSRQLLLSAAGVCVLVGSIFVWNGVPDDADRYLGPNFACLSFGLVDKVTPSPDVALADSANPCGAVLHSRMKSLNHSFKYLLAAVSTALILGTISCLGLPASPTAADRKRALERLKSYLYLSAVMLVCGLAFLGALLRWPAFSVGDDASVKAGVSAILLYWGIVYSVFIASYYIPVALFGAERWAPLGPAGEGESPLTPIGLVRAGAAIFAPALVGLASGLVKL